MSDEALTVRRQPVTESAADFRRWEQDGTNAFLGMGPSKA
eukprot:COSAG01_NODE_38913_length_483_cov_2.203125_1_plen_39_part_10